jgi:hypothetical protein
LRMPPRFRFQSYVKKSTGIRLGAGGDFKSSMTVCLSPEALLDATPRC